MAWTLIGFLQDISYQTTLGCSEKTPQNLKMVSCDGILGWSKDWKDIEWVRLHLAGITRCFPCWRTVPFAESLLPVTKHWHCWLTTTAVPGTVARLQPGVPLIYWVCLKLRFTWGSSPSHSLRQLQPDRWLQGTQGYVCVYRYVCIVAFPPPRNSFFWATLIREWTCWPWPAPYDSCWPCHWQQFGVRGFLHCCLEESCALPLLHASPVSTHSAAPCV